MDAGADVVSGGKDAALDIRYGRGGGRRAGSPHLLVELRRERARLQRAGRWMVVDDRDCTVTDCARKIADHAEPCRVCGRSPEHHKPGEEDLEWEGKARMARARLAAGRPLATVDHEALDRFPEPRGWAA